MWNAIFGSSSYLPHGYCFTWTPGLLWSMVGADAVIAVAYFSIPLAIMQFIRQRKDFSLNWLAWTFSAFIFFCGVTHVMDIWTIWYPDYGLQALTKTITAGISIVTAIAMWPLIPKALRLPSVHQQQSVIDSLEAEMRKRRNAEEHLADMQQNLAVTLSSIGAGFIATDRAGNVTRMNAVAEEVSGWMEISARGENLWNVLVRENGPVGYQSLNAVDLMIRKNWSVDTTHHILVVSRTGTRTALEVKAALTYAEDGTVRGMAIVFRDTTRLTQVEAEAKRLAAIVESSSDAIIGNALDGRITSWNHAAEKMFGYTAAEIIGKPLQHLIPPGGEADQMGILAYLALGASVPAFDTMRRASDGQLLQVSVTASPIRDADGHIIGASNIVRDVRRQRQAERALRDSEARLRFVLDSAKIGDWDMDLATGETCCSLQYARCFGHETVLQDWDFDRFARQLHAEDRDAVVDQFRASVAMAKDLRITCRIVWPDTSVHWISLHGNLRFEAGKATRMLGIVTDMTQQRQAEETRVTTQRLEAENQQIQEASRMKSQFMANMSHELRTPLNAIIGFADLLHRGSVPPGSMQHHEFLGHIGASGRHLLKLINDVLDLSKVESGRFQFFPEPLVLSLLVKGVVDILHAAILKKRIDVGIDIDPAIGGIVLDPARLKQVLYNYLSNAIKFTPEGGRVTVRARTEGPVHFRLEVEDTGIGIADKDLPRLFTDFQQLDVGSAKQHEGSGLGLALTRRLVQAQGGSVGVRSVLGSGSVFYFVLNLVHGTDEEIRAAEAQPEAPAAPPAVAQASGGLRLMPEPTPLPARQAATRMGARP